MLIITAIFLFLAIAAIVLLLSTGHIIDYSWYYVIPVISALIIGPILTALQWLFPLSPIEARQQIQELTEREDNQKQTLLKNVEGLSPGVNISVYREKFGTPTFINHNEEKK